MLSLLASRSPAGWNGPLYSRLEGRHGAGSANNLRAIVLDANGGLVSTFCVVMSVAGTAAMGEWISMQSARELQERQIASEAEELSQVPVEEQEELALIYQAKGFTA